MTGSSFSVVGNFFARVGFNDKQIQKQLYIYVANGTFLYRFRASERTPVQDGEQDGESFPCS